MSPSVEAWMYAEIVSPWGWENRGRYSQSVKKVGFGRRLAVISAAWFCWIVVRAASKVWLCRSASWMASSSVILAGPVHGIEASTAQTDQAPRLVFKGSLRFRQHILIPRDPDIERRQKYDAHHQGGSQPAHDDNGERPLRIRSDGVRKRRGQQSDSGHEHGGHDGTQPQDSALHRGIHDRAASRAELVNVFEHDNAGLHRHAKQSQEANAGGHTEIGAGKKQRQQAA